ncbi:kinesin-like protein KIF20A [Heptranchias perlo]|uniref:kinesin-like protein KIF20A n=1 Tax=Heptranchias perlo TaxID=212740 RepID=UPI00355A7AAE
MAAGIISPNVFSDDEEAPVWESTAVDTVNGAVVNKQLLPELSLISPGTNTTRCPDPGQTPVETSPEERVKIYLRVRPFTETELEKGESQGCVLIESSETLVLQAPKDSFAMRSTERGIGQAVHKFTFSQIFGPETTQKLFFDVVVKNLVKEALEGQNCLVYTYGVSNSGKTYTIQGSRHDSGILPRSLSVIFSSIQGKLYPRMDLKPNLCNDVIKLDNKMVRQEELKKLSLLGIVREEDLQTPMKKNISTEFRQRAGLSCDSDSGIGGMSSVSNLEESASRWADHDTVLLHQEERIQYSIWVSFFEIYNELAYDLLDTAPAANRKRQTSKLCEDKNGNTYVKDLTWINVNDAEEAWKILKIGRKNQSMASTHVNQNSSRSHSIFSIRILHVSEDWQSILKTSELTLCDLAGSERCKEQKCGDRMKEATNINTSLHTLGRCINALRQNQQIKSKPNVVPFRDSKLTRVFQGFFSNHGKSCMIVNVNQCASTYDETLQVMKFSAIASQLIQAPSSKLFPSIRSLLREHNGWNNCNAQEPVEEQEELDDDYDEEEGDTEDETDISTLDKESLQKIIEGLQQHLIQEKQEKLLMESEIRQSVVNEMMEQYNVMERHWREQLEEQKDRLEDAFEAKMKNYQEYVKFYYQLSSAEEEDSDDSDDSDDMCDGKALSKKISELEATIQQLKAERKSSGRPTRQSARLTSTNLHNELQNLQLELVNVKTELEQSKTEAAFSAEELKRYKDMVEPPAGMKHLTVDADRKLEEGQRNAKALQKELQKIEQAMQASERACCHNTGAEKLRRTLAKCEDLMAKQDHTLAELQKLMIVLKLDLKRKNACIAEQYHTVRQLREGPGCNKRRCAANIENQPPPEKRPFLTGLLTPLRSAQQQSNNTPSNYILRSRARLDKPFHLSSAKYRVNY